MALAYFLSTKKRNRIRNIFSCHRRVALASAQQLQGSHSLTLTGFFLFFLTNKNRLPHQTDKERWASKATVLSISAAHPWRIIQSFSLYFLFYLFFIVFDLLLLHFFSSVFHFLACGTPTNELVAAHRNPS